jgi:hypothetical protein
VTVSPEELSNALDSARLAGPPSDYQPFGPPFVSSLHPDPPKVKTDSPSPAVIINVTIGTVIVVDPAVT